MPPCLWETCFIIDYCIVPNLSSSSTTMKRKSFAHEEAYIEKYLLFRCLNVTFV